MQYNGAKSFFQQMMLELDIHRQKNKSEWILSS